MDLPNFAQLPTKLGQFQIKSYPDTISTLSDIALWHSPFCSGIPVYVRIHSECLTGDVFGSQRCDCGAQLKESMDIISRFGGILIYLRQEGRGIGLHAKIEAYKLQDTGLDTVDANLQLGFEPDLRDYTKAIEILNEFSLSEINLLTNNPEKIQSLTDAGYKVHAIPLITGLNAHNEKYIQTKKEKFAHLF